MESHSKHHLQNEIDPESIYTHNILKMKSTTFCSEALSVHDSRTGIIILILRDPHLLERRQRGKDRTSDPNWVLPLRRSHDLYFDRSGCQWRHLFGQTDIDVREHGGTSRQHRVGVQIPSDIHIAFHDRFVRQFVDSFAFFADETRFEEHLIIVSKDMNHEHCARMYCVDEQINKPLGIGIALLPQWSPDHPAVRSSSQDRTKYQLSPIQTRNPRQHMPTSPWCPAPKSLSCPAPW